MEVTINNDSKLTLCPNLTSEEDINNMIQRIASYRQVGIDPRNIILGYMSKDDIDSQHRVLHLIVCLALEEKVIGIADMYSDASIFVNPQSLDLLLFNPDKAITIKIHRPREDKVEFMFRTSDLVNFLIQSVSMVHDDDVPESLPNNALLFHACSSITRNYPTELNTQISTGEVNLLISDHKVIMLDHDISTDHGAQSKRLH